MHHLKEHINQDKTRRYSKDNNDSTVNKTEYRSKRNQQVNPCWPDKQPKHQALLGDIYLKKGQSVIQLDICNYVVLRLVSSANNVTELICIKICIKISLM